MRFKNGEFSFGFQGFCKNRGVGWFHTDNKMKKNKKNNKRGLLEVSGYWALDSRATEGSSGSFPLIGEDDLYSHFPNLVFI